MTKCITVCYLAYKRSRLVEEVKVNDVGLYKCYEYIALQKAYATHFKRFKSIEH